MNRELKRRDLPKTRSSGKSLHIPVITKRGVKKYVCDIHFSDETLCYLEGAKGKPTKISSLLIEDKVLKRLYFESNEDIFCKPLEHFMHYAKIEGLKKITLIEAIRDTETKDYVWCTHVEEVTEREMCKKAECPHYSSKSGRGVCEHRGKLYLHGDEVTLNVF